MLKEKNDLKFQIEKLNSEFRTNSKHFEDKITELENRLKETQGINLSLKRLNDEFNENNIKLDADFKEKTQICVQQNVVIQELRDELNRMGITLETSVSDSQLELKSKLDKLSKELNSKCSETLR